MLNNKEASGCRKWPAWCRLLSETVKGDLEESKGASWSCLFGSAMVGHHHPDSEGTDHLETKLNKQVENGCDP